MTKAELETQLKMSNEANVEAFKIIRGIMYALREHNYGTAESRCSNGIRKLDDCVNANQELLGK